MFENVKVRDLMTKQVISIPSVTPISTAHQLMKEHGVRRLTVVDNGHLVGIVTLGDIREASPSDATTLSIWELNYLWAQLNVERVMSHNVLTIREDASVLDAAQIMLEQKVSGLPVLDQDGQLVGIITESDIFRMLVKSRIAVEA